ncbi:MAG: site-specific integrase [Piscinibacter sp.]|uniref:tyrosine-type recombinase/integrase n=1 Tax=Piscinibacter sp. TaxID=1903157 RepID=UPI002582F03E|nr:site-specific integrase [Piscinibacter sp.]MCW5665461.1 site-specific integrase [Piscinibacter sp.]
MKSEGLSDSTVQKELALLKAALNVAIREWGWADFRNPATGIRLGRSRRRFVRLTEEQEAQLVQSLSTCDNPQFWPLVELAMTTTMRRGSLLSLRWSDISLETREAHVWAKGTPITLPLSRRSAELLRLIPDNGSGRVFSMSANAVKLAWEGVRERAGLQWLRFADLRHLGATFYARAGLSAHQLRLVLGHTTTRTAEFYVDMVNSDVTEALDLAEAARPIRRPMPPAEVHRGRPSHVILAERRTRRLNGPVVMAANVIPLSRRSNRQEVETDGESPEE